MSDLAVILVHYQAAKLAVAAVHALRRELEKSSLEVEWLVVDNGSDAAGAAELAALPAEVLTPGRNLGFAGGVNLGVERSAADLLLVLNPDVEILPGCLHTLLRTLKRRRAHVIGPRFYWDRGRRFLLPPPERRSWTSEVMARLPRRWPATGPWARGSWRRHAWRSWQASEPIESYDLSGALMLFRRSAWRHVGPFDTGYRLYFEETDWLRRLRRSGLRGCFEPRAEAIHLFARSAVTEPSAADWFAESSARFHQKHYGQAFSRLLAHLDAPPTERARSRTRTRTGSLEEPYRLKLDDSVAWVELSPSPFGLPAAAEPIAHGTESWMLPGELTTRLDPGCYSLQLVDRRGGELGRYTFSHPCSEADAVDGGPGGASARSRGSLES